MNNGEVTKQSHPKVHSSLRKVLSKGRWVPLPIKPVETGRIAACPQSYRGQGGGKVESQGNIIFLRFW